VAATPSSSPADETVRQSEGQRQSGRDWQQFLETAVHDLSTPLRGISTSASLLAEMGGYAASEDARQLLEMLQDNVVRMSALLKALGEYAMALQIDASSFVPVPADAVVRSALGNLAVMIQNTGASIHYTSLPRVCGSWEYLSTLFQHLLANAMQYRSAAPPHVTISAERAHEDWRFAVRDNGAGIDGRYHDLIFEPFQRLHGSDQPGAGLGLTICKKIVELHGGRIWIESKIGDGSTCFFTLPPAGIE
jgi:light-regulated signal transduction histidine kinase (bacteriophytochrome)